MAGELIELVTSADPELTKRVVAGVQNAIMRSFKERPVNRMTATEVKRRFVIAEKWIRELRREHGWAFTRILDVLPTILISELDGVAWDPTKQRALWTG